MEGHFNLTQYIPIDSKEKVDHIVEEYKSAHEIPSMNHCRIIYDWIHSSDVLIYAENAFERAFNISIKLSRLSCPWTKLSKPSISKNVQDSKPTPSSISSVSHSTSGCITLLDKIPAEYQIIIDQYKNAKTLAQAVALRQYLKSIGCSKSKVKEVIRETLPDEVYLQLYPLPNPAKLKPLMKKVKTKSIGGFYTANNGPKRFYNAGIKGYNPKSESQALYNKYEYGLSDW